MLRFFIELHLCHPCLFICGLKRVAVKTAAPAAATAAEVVVVVIVVAVVTAVVAVTVTALLLLLFLLLLFMQKYYKDATIALTAKLNMLAENNIHTQPS